MESETEKWLESLSDQEMQLFMMQEGNELRRKIEEMKPGAKKERIRKEFIKILEGIEMIHMESETQKWIEEQGKA